MARPRKEFDQEQFEKLCALQCTEEEIAHWFDMCADTLNARIKELYGEGFSDVYKKHSDEGRMSLRRYQFEMAKTNVAMAIWLGKQYLNQKDTPMFDNRLTQIAVNYKELNDESIRTQHRTAPESK